MVLLRAKSLSEKERALEETSEWFSLNIWGHKRKAKEALEQQKYYESKIEERGNRAKRLAKFFCKIRKWHLNQIRILRY